MKTHGGVPSILPNLDAKVGPILPPSAKKDNDTGITKHVYVMEPDVRNVEVGNVVRNVDVANVAATIVIPGAGTTDLDLSRDVYLYR